MFQVLNYYLQESIKERILPALTTANSSRSGVTPKWPVKQKTIERSSSNGSVSYDVIIIITENIHIRLTL